MELMEREGVEARARIAGFRGRRDWRFEAFIRLEAVLAASLVEEVMLSGYVDAFGVEATTV